MKWGTEDELLAEMTTWDPLPDETDPRWDARSPESDQLWADAERVLTAATVSGEQGSALEFQQECLTRLSVAGGAGDAEPSHLAYLTDRVRLARDQPQVYVTQFWRGPDGTDLLVSQPIEDEAHVDERPAAVGLEPLAAHVAQMQELYGVR